jgi:hypothetical protein
MTLYLRHGPGAGALQKRALAQVLAKTLFRQTNPATATELGSSAAALLAIGMIPLGSTEEALEFLRTEGTATANEARWSLTEAGERRIASANDERSIRLERILKARFGSAIPLEQLKVWFVATLAQYFERYGSETVAVLFRSAPSAAAPVLLSDLIETTARNGRLGQYVAQLTTGFRAIIESPTTDEI